MYDGDLRAVRKVPSVSDSVKGDSYIKYHATHCEVGEVIGVLLEISLSMTFDVTFFKNGKNLGKGFKGATFSEELVPTVRLGFACSQVTVSHKSPPEITK